MSKRQTNTTTIWNRLRRGLACLLTLALLAGLVPGTAVTAYAASSSQHWAMPYAQKLVDWGVMRGDVAGNLRLDAQITRAEFVTMMNRAYGYTKLGGHPFTDVRYRDWFAEDIDIAYNMGYFKGTSPTTASPNAPLSREQATVLLARNMMLQTKPGESLGFSDSRSLSDWSRGLVAAAAESGLVSGMADGSFQPQRNITRGEVATMLVRAIGNPINTKGDHTLGNVYGNVTVSTAGVTLRDGVIAGNLYLTGGIDLGDVLLQNVNVLGEIIVSGGGESNSSAASIIMRNVTADNMVVDSISDQFVTIRAEGNTSIPTTTVRTNAYVDDSSLPGFGLSFIELAGDPGTMLQLAGNTKEVLNRTPQSDLQVVQGTAQKITMDEYATDSTVLVDGDARIEELNLDVATNVTGTGDIKNLNVGAAGSTVEQLPDNITIRPGITSDINGSQMNSVQAAESSADPRLLAGYPKVKNIAPNSATLVFSANKPGTIYWAISAVSDGSVDEDDLIEPPVYGGNIIRSGTINATASKTEYTVNLTGLTQDGSYYVSAILVDGRGNRSPLKVTAFTTPDGTTPAFNSGYPYMSKVSTETAQVTVMPNKSCRMYYTLLPTGSTAPTPAEFKANAITGNLGYGVVDVVKNVTQPVNVNSTRLQELTRYTLYLWLTDYDGAKSSQVYSLSFTTPDEQAPVIVTKEQTNADATAIELTFTLNESATLYWAIIPEGQDKESSFEGISEGDWNKDTISDPNDRRLQIRIENGAGSSVVKNGRKAVNAAYTNAQVTLNETRPLDAGTSNYTMYLVAKDAAGNYSKVEKIHVHTRDGSSPTVRQEFSKTNEGNQNQPLVDTDIRLVFSENVQGGSDQSRVFLDLYQKVKDAPNDTTSADRRQLEADARNTLARALYDYIKLYHGNTAGDERNPAAYNINCEVDASGEIVNGTRDPSGAIVPNDNWVINYCAATVEQRNGELIVTFPTGTGLRLTSGGSYHFIVSGIRDLSADDPNPLDPDPTNLPAFTTMYARVNIKEVSQRPPVMNKAVDGNDTLFEMEDGAYKAGTLPQAMGSDGKPINENQRIDRSFSIIRQFDPSSVTESPDMCYDILIWSDSNMEITLYSRPVNANGQPITVSDDGTETVNQNAPWEREGVMSFTDTGREGWVFRSVNQMKGSRQPDYLHDFQNREYAIHVNELSQLGTPSKVYNSWSQTVNLRVSVVAGTDTTLDNLSLVGYNFQTQYNAFVPSRLSSIGVPDPFYTDILFTDRQPPKIIDITMRDSDTSPLISITLNNPGRVNYIIFPVTNLRYVPTGSTGDPVAVPPGTRVDTILGQIGQNYATSVTVTTSAGVTRPPIDSITKINSGINGIELSAPARDLVVDGSFTAGQNVIKGSTQPTTAGVGVDIEGLMGLTPNTIYYLCVLPQGTTSQSYDDHAYAYIFTTTPAERPILSLQSGAGVDVTATVDRTSTVSSRLLRMDMLGSQIFFQRFDTDANIAPGLSFPTSGYTPRFGTNSYTVLDALYDDYLGEQNNYGDHPSVFDAFASEDLKRQVRQWVESGGGGFGTTAGTWDPRRVTVSTGGHGTANMTFPRGTGGQNDTGPIAGLDYVCVAMAQSSSSDSILTYAFRAAAPLRLTNNQTPRIVDVTVAGLTYDGTKTTGSITILFDTYLYYIQDATHRYPLAQTAGNLGQTITSGGTQYLGLSGIIRPTPSNLTIDDVGTANISTISSITLNLPAAGVTGHPAYSIAFPAGVASQWSPMSGGFTVNLSFDATAGAYTYTVNPRTMLLNP